MDPRVLIDLFDPGSPLWHLTQRAYDTEGDLVVMFDNNDPFIAGDDTLCV